MSAHEIVALIVAFWAVSFVTWPAAASLADWLKRDAS